MSLRSLNAFALALLVVCACGPGTPGPGIDVDRVMAHVNTLAAAPRPRDSDGSRAAAGYIEDELSRLGLDVERMPVGTVDLPAIEVLGATYRQAHRVVTTDPNLVVRFGPPGKALLLMAHYDTVGVSPGAVDNAAAVGVLLELSRVLAEAPPEAPVMIAFTANEEIGLVGAEVLAERHRDAIDFAIALDLIGGDGQLVVNGASQLIGLAELDWLRRGAKRAGVDLGVPQIHRVLSRWWPQAERSDHGPFTRRGVRAVHFYHRGHDGEWIDLAYHSAGDVPARVRRDALSEIGRMLIALVDAPLPAHAGDAFWIPIASLVVPRWALLVCELVLAAIVLLSLRERAGPAPARGPGLFAGIGCYAVAVGVAMLVERAAAEYEAAPIHQPLAFVIASALVLAGTLGLLTRLIARFKPWTGTHRYRVLASLVCLAIGGALVAIDAPELAWVWLIPAVVIARAPKAGWLAVPGGLVALAAAALPVVLVLRPERLREAAWNGFLPPSLPIALWVGVLGIPFIATGAWWLRSRPRPGPLGTLALGLGCGLAVIAGLVVALAADSPCSPAEFEAFKLACERV